MRARIDTALPGRQPDGAPTLPGDLAATTHARSARSARPCRDAPYVPVAVVKVDGRGQLKVRNMTLRNELNRASATSHYPLHIMRMHHPDGLVLTVGGLQSRIIANEILSELKQRSSPIQATMVRSDRVVRPGDGTTADARPHDQG